MGNEMVKAELRQNNVSIILTPFDTITVIQHDPHIVEHNIVINTSPKEILEALLMYTKKE